MAAFDYILAHSLVVLASNTNVVTRRHHFHQLNHHLHKIKIWSSDSGDLYFIKIYILWFISCSLWSNYQHYDLLEIGSKFGQWMTSLALVPKLATRLSHFHCHLPRIAILALSACIELVAWSARVTSVKLAKPLLETDRQTDRQRLGHIDRTPGHQGPINIVNHVKSCILEYNCRLV